MMQQKIAVPAAINRKDTHPLSNSYMYY